MPPETPENNNLIQNPEEAAKISPEVLNLKDKKPADALPSWPKDLLKTETKEYALGKMESRAGKFLKWGFGILVVLVIILGIAGAFYLYQFNKAGNTSLVLKAPKDVLIGVPFEIEAVFGNDSEKTFSDVRFSLTLPEDIVCPDSPDKKVIIKEQGQMEPNSNVLTKFPLTIFGVKHDSIEKLTVIASYYPQNLGPKVRFEKTASADVAIREPGIKMDLTAPQKVLNNEIFELKIDYRNISEYKFSNAQLELNYPKYFSFRESSPKPTLGNNIWQLINLEKGTGGTIVIKGNVLASEQTFFEISGQIKINNSVINEKSVSVNIVASPLVLSISLNDQANYVSKTDDSLHYIVSYKNNSEYGLNDTVIKAKLTGEMFDFKSLITKGFFDSRTNTVTWNAANAAELRVISPGAEGMVDFTARTQQAYPIRRLADKNFTLKVDADISSPTIPYYVSADKTASVASLKTNVSGKISVDAKLLYRDKNSEISNTGPIPPKANYPTTFNVHWLITSISTDFKNIEVKSSLLSGVRFTGKVVSSANSVPTFNERTGEVSWLVDSISANKGVLSAPLEATFQIEATPNITQVGQPMPVLSETQLKAIDNFTNLETSAMDNPLTTQLTDDSTITSGQGTVVQ